MSGKASDSGDALLSGPGEARSLARAADWSATPLGPVETWPGSLRVAARLCLGSRTPMAVWAGPQLVLIHNDGFAALLGADPHRPAMGHGAREVWSGRWEAIGPTLEQVLESGLPARCEDAPFRIRRDGREEDARCTYTLTPIPESDGRVVGVLHIVEAIRPSALSPEEERGRDLSELRAAQARLLDADRRKNEFLAMLSHELRNPLAPIKNSLYILDRVAPGGDQARRAKGVIERQINQLTHVVDDLLDVTRVARGKMQLQRSRLELNELVRRTLEDHRTLFEGSGLGVELETAPEVFVDADGNRIAQVLGNLLQNAAKFTQRGGRVKVTVSTDAAARQAMVRVADTGAGMSADVLARIFEPFMQADSTVDRSKGGLGIGLALVKGVVEQHGGSVDARSEGIGRGTEFTVRLPLDLTQAVERERPAAAGAKVRRRVLIIEDNVDAAHSLKDMLELDGHAVAVAYDGPDGIAKARELLPEYVLCDIGLPGMNGYDVARALRADGALRSVHLVALSGYALPEDLQRAAEAGFELHLAKPPTREKLDGLLGGVLDR
jgi:signal transduction histidine kinase